MSRLGLFVTAFALATGAFWFTMLTDPPRSAAATKIAVPPPAHAVAGGHARFVPEELCGRFGACPE